MLPPAAPRESDYPFWTYSDLASWFFFYLPATLLAWGAVKAAAAAGWRAPNHAVELLVAEMIAYGFWFAALYLLLRSRYGRPFAPSLAWHLPPGVAGPCLVLGAILGLAVGLLGVLLRTPNVSTPMRELLRQPYALALVSVLAVTLGPICEELAFRGFMLPLLIRSLGVKAGIVVAAIPFALLHGQQNGWLWQPIVLIALAGSAFGYVRYRTGSTAAAAIVHASYNAVFVVAQQAQTLRGGG